MNLVIFKEEILAELQKIIRFWLNNSFDDVYGGFIGKMDSNGMILPNAAKGEVLNARILWTFSAAYHQQFCAIGLSPTNKMPDSQLLQAANRAYQYINLHFRDRTYGGVYWSVDAKGNPLNTRKQIYGLAFTIYGLTEYFKATQKQEVLDFAIELFELIEFYSFDKKTGGYIEAFTQNWEIIEDLRLSEKDRNDPKTMNTHLHIIEAYLNLYKVWNDAHLKLKIRHLLDIFEHKIIDSETSHTILFFDNEWHRQCEAISYGHDIESSWLLFDAAKTLKDAKLIKKWKQIAVKMANASALGLNSDGSLNHEFNPNSSHFDTHREWWVSAEAMVGFYNAYQITNEEHFQEKVFNLWNFTKLHLLDRKNGEWFWGVYEDYSLMKKEDKIGFWKCPYHNARACMELLNRL